MNSLRCKSKIIEFRWRWLLNKRELLLGKRGLLLDNRNVSTPRRWIIAHENSGNEFLIIRRHVIILGVDSCSRISSTSHVLISSMSHVLISMMIHVLKLGVDSWSTVSMTSWKIVMVHLHSTDGILQGFLDTFQDGILQGFLDTLSNGKLKIFLRFSGHIKC